MVRPGTYEDIPSIVSMSQEFWANTIYDEPCCPETVSDMARFCIDQNMMSVLEVGNVVGFACGVVGPLLGNRAVKTGTEIAWWVDPEHRAGRNGIALLRHIEKLAKESGVKYWNMVYMESSMPEQVKKIYEAMGYRPAEVTYVRVL